MGKTSEQSEVAALQAQVAQLQAQLQAEIARRESLEAEHRQLRAEVQEMATALERRVVERTAALRASEAMLRYLLARMNDGYVILNAEDRIIYANPQACLYLGLHEGIHWPTPQTFLELARNRYACEPQSVWRYWPHRVFVGDEPAPLYLVQPETAAASAFWLQVDVLDVPAGIGEAAGRIVHLRDVTDRAALQEQLSKFHSIISHKLRTPLVPVYSGLQYLQYHVERLSREEIVDFVREAFAGIAHLYEVVEDILRYVNVAGKREVDELFDLTALGSLIVQVSQRLGLKTVVISMEGDFEGVKAPFSTYNMELLLLEILENSWKFHPQHAPHVEVKVIRRGERVILRVADDGVTLSPQQLARMWLPYYQAEKHVTGQVPGLGLGLSLVATQVWSVGGTCRAFNRPGGPGIVVELVLPLRREEV